MRSLRVVAVALLLVFVLTAGLSAVTGCKKDAVDEKTGQDLLEPLEMGPGGEKNMPEPPKPGDE